MVVSRSRMNEISFAVPEIAASRQRGIPTDEGELWETLRLDAERAAAGEEMLRGFLDLAVLRHNAFASGLGLLCGAAVRYAHGTLTPPFQTRE
jgi:hypothetical protein